MRYGIESVLEREHHAQNIKSTWSRKKAMASTSSRMYDVYEIAALVADGKFEYQYMIGTKCRFSM